MLCPNCSHDDSKVIDSRDAGAGIRRRRECLECDGRFTTYEQVQVRELMVVKRDGRREDLDREKLIAGITKACAKRPLPTGSIDKLVQEIELAVVDSGRREVSSEAIGQLVMEKLKEMDRVAYIRYASIYRDFKDVETFREEIDSLLEPPAEPAEASSQLTYLEEEIVQRPRRRGRPQKLTESGRPAEA
jgi:transcriptional repressor NrdR